MMTYTGNGSQVTFSVPFDYLQKNFVKASVDNVTKTYGTDYTVNGHELTFVKAPTGIIKIWRETPTERLVEWNEGSTLTASDMTLQQAQQLHIIEENTYRMKRYGLVKTDDESAWEGQYLPFIHLMDSDEPTSAVTKEYVTKEEGSFLATLKNALNNYLDSLKAAYEDYSAKLKKQFDGYTASLKSDYDAYTSALLNSFNTHKANLKAYYDSLIKEFDNIFHTDKTTLDNLVNTGRTYRDEASTSASKAKTSETNSKTSETNAKASEVAAAESAKQAAYGQINADWNETNADSKAYIKNKPDVPTRADVANSVTTKTLTVSGETSVPTANEGNSSKAIASTEFVQRELTNYLPLSGGSTTGDVDITGNLSVSGAITGNVMAYTRKKFNETSKWEDNTIQSIARAFPDDHPDAYPYGVKVTLGKIKNEEGHTNLYFPHNGGMYLKNYWGSDSNISGWLTILTDQNYSQFALPKGGTAVKATADAAGNNIQSTYVKQGGMNLWNALHNNTTSNLKGLSNDQWNALGFFIRYFSTNDNFENQPSQYGQLINIPADTGHEATQLFIEQNSGRLYFRGGNAEIAMKDVKFNAVAYWDGNEHLKFPNGAEMWVY